jgi:hypothetical protein
MMENQSYSWQEPTGVVGQASRGFCGHPHPVIFVDLGISPPCESVVSTNRLNHMEPFHPLQGYVRDACSLVRPEEYVSPEAIFYHYACSSSYSISWLDRSRRRMGGMIEWLRLVPSSRVVEAESNDDHLLHCFLPYDTDTLCIEPAVNAAREPEEGLPAVSSIVNQLRQRELTRGLGNLAGYAAFASLVEWIKRQLLSFLIDVSQEGKLVAGCGRPVKRNRLLNYCGIRTDLFEHTVNRNPPKWGIVVLRTPIPVFTPERLAEIRLDHGLALTRDLKEEIMAQLEYLRSIGGRFVALVPEVQVP